MELAATVTTMSAFVGTQILIIGAGLLVAALTKIGVPYETRQRTLIGVLSQLAAADPQSRRSQLRSLWWSVIVIELALGTTVLLPWSRTAGLSAAAIFFAGTLAIGAWGLHSAPDAGCGCFGASSRITPWTLARSSWLLLSTAVCLNFGSRTDWAKGATRDYLLVVGINAIVFGLCSERARQTSARALEAVRAAVVYPVRSGDQAAKRALAQVTGSPYWLALKEAGIPQTTVPARIWRQRDWILMDFPGTFERRTVDIVAGVRIGYQPAWCRVAIIDPSDPRLAALAAWDSIAAAHQRTSGAAPEIPRSRRPAEQPQPLLAGDPL